VTEISAFDASVGRQQEQAACPALQIGAPVQRWIWDYNQRWMAPSTEGCGFRMTPSLSGLIDVIRPEMGLLGGAAVLAI
jgi:hypothetical protein